MESRGRGARRPWHWLVAIALLLLSSSAMALGLGQIKVLSAPGQPLLAEIPIISNAPGELENARARLASPETFARVGLQPPAGLVRDLQFEITADAQGRAVVRVTSRAPVTVPAVGFLVEVDWGQGRLVREYSALVAAPQTAVAIEPAQVDAPQALPSDTIIHELPSAPVAVEDDMPESVADAPAPPADIESSEPPPPAPPPMPAPMPVPAAPAPASAAHSVDAGEVLARVERGQTLSQLAVSMDRGGYTLNQTMLALLQANPQAFIGGNIHRLRSGAVLRMPAADDFAPLDVAGANALVREQTEQWRQAMRPVPQPADPSAAPGTSTATAPPPAAPATAGSTGARLEIAPAVAAAGTQATESGLGAGGEGDMLANQHLRQAQEDLAARDSELQELRSRVDELEQLQQQQMKLIELKDSELAAAQQRLAQVQQPGATEAENTAAVDPVWWWGGLALIVVTAVVWWLARRPKPLPIPSAGGRRAAGWDAATLAAAMPAPAGTAASDADNDDEASAQQDHAHSPHAPDAAPAASAPEQEMLRIPGWHDADAAVELGPLNPAPAGRERLELAIAYLDLGDTETARTLLHEVAAGEDADARDEAAQLLREIG